MWNLKNAARELAPVVRAFPAHPVRVVKAMPDEWRQRMGRASVTDADFDDDWNEHLHGLLGAPWPCPEYQGFDEVIADIGAVLEARGWGFGRDTYAWYSDGDTALCRAAWCVVLHTQPEVVIETGVAHGVTSRVVLEALGQNDLGHLWSIDLPFPFDHRLHGETGIVVPDACRPRWSYLEGSSKQRLPPLAAEVGQVELFIHDSLHTAENTLFEMEQAASAMPKGGVMLVDDIDSHAGFTTFAERHPEYRTIICPDADRNTKEGMFGIAVNA